MHTFAIVSNASFPIFLIKPHRNIDSTTKFLTEELFT